MERTLLSVAFDVDLDFDVAFVLGLVILTGNGGKSLNQTGRYSCGTYQGPSFPADSFVPHVASKCS